MGCEIHLTIYLLILTFAFAASFTLAIAAAWTATTTWSIHAAASLVWRKLATLNGFAIRAGYIGCFIALFTQNHIEFNDLFIAHRTYGLLWVVIHDGRLMNENILFGVVAIDEAISALHIEPLDGARNLFSCETGNGKRKKGKQN